MHKGTKYKNTNINVRCLRGVHLLELASTFLDIQVKEKVVQNTAHLPVDSIGTRWCLLDQKTDTIFFFAPLGQGLYAVIRSRFNLQIYSKNT